MVCPVFFGFQAARTSNRAARSQLIGDKPRLPHGIFNKKPITSRRILPDGDNRQNFPRHFPVPRLPGIQKLRPAHGNVSQRRIGQQHSIGGNPA